MAVIEHPTDYKGLHVEKLLRQVPAWNAGGAAAAAPWSSGADYELSEFRVPLSVPLGA